VREPGRVLRDLVVMLADGGDCLSDLSVMRDQPDLFGQVASTPLLSLAYSFARFLTDLCLVRIRSDAQLRAEVLALRHQLRILERKLGKPRWKPGDRLLLASLSRLLPRSAWSALLPSPETLL
jgi:hypothetical protein